jgi:hypothetical protein
VLGVEHWTQQLNAAGPPPRQARLRRAALLNDILSLYRVRVDDWQGATMAIHGPTGRTELADTLTDLWPKVEMVVGHPLDPLDPALLEHLQHLTRGEGR